MHGNICEVSQRLPTLQVMRKQGMMELGYMGLYDLDCMHIILFVLLLSARGQCLCHIRFA